MDIYVAN